MKIYFCTNCNKIDQNNIFEERCSFCGSKKEEDTSFISTEYSDLDNLIINQHIYNSIFGGQR